MIRKNYKTIIAHILSLCVIFSMFVFADVSIKAEDTGISVWDGQTSTEIKKGSGTKEDPYLVETGANLYYLVQKATSGYFKITDDIYLNDVSGEEWENNLANKWALTWSSFKGTLDGDGHIIYGLYNDAAADRMGLFPALQAGATVKNLKISKSKLNNTSANKYAGAVCGMTYGYATFKNCAVDETVSVNAGYAGSIVGAVSLNGEMKFEGCYSAATVGGTTAAGFVANAWNGGSNKKIAIENSICINSFFIKKNGGILTEINNSYSTNNNESDRPADVGGNYGKVAADGMKGENAVVNMPALQWETTFVKTDSYPELRIFKSNEPLYWYGNPAAKLVNGSGSRNDPYIISTPSELAYLAKLIVEGGGNNTVGKYYELANDITINNTTAENWTESARKWYSSVKVNGNNYCFNGFLNGKGYTISGLYSDDSTSGAYAGLFVGISSGATVARLNISNSVMSAQFVGSIAGREFNTADKVIKIANVYIDDKVSLKAAGAVGGIIGRGDGGISFINCGFSGLATGAGDDKTHGIAGDIWSVGTKYEIKNTFSNCKPYRLLTGLKIELSNVYSSSAQTGVTQVTDEFFGGIDASTKMSGLDFVNTWQANENGYPTLSASHNGDVDLDGECNAADCVELRKELLGVSEATMPDVNDDGKIDIRDLVAEKKLQISDFQNQ